LAPASDEPGDPAGPRSLDRRVLVVWTVEEAIAWAVLVALVVAADVGARLAGLELPWPTGVAAVPFAILGALGAWRIPLARYRTWSYEMAQDALELRHGIFELVHSAIPYYRVQYIDITQDPIERAVGLSKLKVHTAAASSDSTIPGIPAGEAETLRRRILARTGAGDAV
jgi:uncharacterized protein